jgi:uncharacterized protein YjiS (DUF1127 family)
MTSMTINGQAPVRSGVMLDFVRSMTAAFSKWSERNSNASALGGLSARQLNDIGLDAANDDLPVSVRAVWAA